MPRNTFKGHVRLPVYLRNLLMPKIPRLPVAPVAGSAPRFGSHGLGGAPLCAGQGEEGIEAGCCLWRTCPLSGGWYLAS